MAWDPSRYKPNTIVRQARQVKVALDSAYYTRTTCFMAVKSTTGSPPQPQQAYTTDDYDVILQIMVRIM